MITAIVKALGGVRATIFAAALVAAAVWGSAQWAGKLHAERQLATTKASYEMANAAVAKQAQERYAKLAQSMYEIGEKHEQDLARIKQQREAIAADLRSARLQLRREWTCPIPGPGSSPASAAVADEDARLRTEGAAAFIADGAEADRWITNLQAIIRKYQEVYGRVHSGQE